MRCRRTSAIENLSSTKICGSNRRENLILEGAKNPKTLEIAYKDRQITNRKDSIEALSKRKLQIICNINSLTLVQVILAKNKKRNNGF